MKTSLKIFIIIANINLLCACTTSGYKANPDSKTANLRLVAIPGNNNDVFINRGVDCIAPRPAPSDEMAILGIKANLVADRQAGRIIGMPLYDSAVPKKQQTELKVEANKPIAFSFAGVGISGISLYSIEYSWCMKKIEFTPVENANYEAVYDIVSTPRGKDCSAKLYEIREVSGSFVKEESKNYKLIENMCKK
ncbi:hypothetical protein GCM10011613_01710 [Cellvibrio zantedeschiae]|uniref:Lipoprotein n=1 Tax=Cellvibrio zantedeschiae TaxID=1237077 RepID=A0ABQ3AME6_9GAMM|nr:hypothetical protein [Cellvibrio zantedeschiae]GGY61918.1 hypothetical protein GCM10011613_01710 [Cellvibrio zantedeschiae]